MKEPILYELIEPFEYAVKGEIQTASFIELRAPTSRNINECSYLKQSFFRALPESDDTTKDETTTGNTDEIEINSDDIITIILRSKDVDINKVLLTSKKLFTSKDVALIDGEEKLTQPLVDLMSIDDLEIMTGKYLVNFILASTLQKMNKK